MKSVKPTNIEYGQFVVILKKLKLNIKQKSTTLFEKQWNSMKYKMSIKAIIN